jgi:hypothetical protein
MYPYLMFCVCSGVVCAHLIMRWPSDARLALQPCDSLPAFRQIAKEGSTLLLPAIGNVQLPC